MPKHRVVRHEVTQPLDKAYRFIPLTQGQVAIVDAEDFEWLSQWKWFAHRDKKTGNFYARRSGPRSMGKRTIFMHREVLLVKAPELTDHKNGDTLDNRRKNLRKATPSENMRNSKMTSDNSSGYRGVSRDRGLWRACIILHGKFTTIGRFQSKKEAALAYDSVARDVFGEFARLNFPHKN